MINAGLERPELGRHGSPSNPALLSQNPATARILIADHHPLVREGLVQLISGQSDLSCCAQAATVAETQSLAAKHRPDLIIVELTLKGGDALELIKVLKAQCPGLRIMIFSEHTGRMWVERGLRAGAEGYVSKERAAAEVLKAIRTVLAGEVYLTRGMAALLFHRFVGAGDQAAPGGGERLSSCELQVFHLLGAERSTREIAADLNRSLKTVQSYRENIKRKLRLRGAELVSTAIQWAGVAASLSRPVEVRTPKTLAAGMPLQT